MKIYLETTMFNYYFDKERDIHNDTVKLFNEIKEGKFEAYTSQYVVDELEDAQEPKRTDMINLIKEYDIQLLEEDEEAEKLMEIYVKEGIIPVKYKYDGIHIAMTTVNDLDCIISCNFQHINKLKTKKFTRLINEKEGYKNVDICTPMEVIENE